jgi:hypothetical protein
MQGTSCERILAIAGGTGGSAVVRARWRGGLADGSSGLRPYRDRHRREQRLRADHSQQGCHIHQSIGGGRCPVHQQVRRGALQPGNYFWLFSGSDQRVGFEDDIPKKKLTTSNLGQQLIARGLSFKGYAEDLPAIGAEDVRTPRYARKHVPWVSFANVPNGKTAESSSKFRCEDFPSDFSKLPTVSFVVPNLFNDMHSGKSSSLIKTDDLWLPEPRDYYRWAKDHNNLLIVTFDENDDSSDFAGLTDPRSTDHSIKNRIVTVFAGEGRSVSRTQRHHPRQHPANDRSHGLAPKSGARQEHVVGAGSSDDFIITDVFTTQ